MARIYIKSGKESHKTSWGRVTVTSGGQYLKNHTSKKWVQHDSHVTDVEAEYDLPDGTELEVVAKGARGPRGVEKYHTERLYRVDSNADVQDVILEAGPYSGRVKGRIVLVWDKEAHEVTPGVEGEF